MSKRDYLTEFEKAAHLGEKAQRKFQKHLFNSEIFTLRSYILDKSSFDDAMKRVNCDPSAKYSSELRIAWIFHRECDAFARRKLCDLLKYASGIPFEC